MTKLNVVKIQIYRENIVPKCKFKLSVIENHILSRDDKFFIN